jgi:hypothetical protein
VTGSKQSVASGIAQQVTSLGLATSPGVSATPANPTATSSTSLKMMGLAAAFTPTNQAPAVLVIITGVAATATAVQAITVGGRYGTGTAPANAAAVTGTRFGAATDPVIGPAALAGNGIPFTLAAVLNLNPGTAYWFDLAVATGNASDAASVTSIGVTIAELP